MNITIICPEYDPAVTGEQLYKSINKYTKHKCRYIVGYPTTIPEWKDGVVINKGVQMQEVLDINLGSSPNHEEAREIIKNSDILHFMQWDWTSRSMEEFYDCFFHGQTIIYHGHGGWWLLDPREQIRRCKEIGAKLLTCSPIDEQVLKGIDSIWMPNIMDLKKIECGAYKRKYDSEYITVSQAVTNTAGEYKNAVPSEYVCEWLERGFDHKVKYVLVQGHAKSKSIEIRQKHHITIDNWIQGFFGLAGLEGMAMGHPMIARLDPMAKEKWETFSNEFIPIIDVKGMDESASYIREYLYDRDKLKEDGLKNRKWMEKYYNEKALLSKWVKFYESLSSCKVDQMINPIKLSLRDKLKLTDYILIEDIKNTNYKELKKTKVPVVFNCDLSKGKACEIMRAMLPRRLERMYFKYGDKDLMVIK